MEVITEENKQINKNQWTRFNLIICLAIQCKHYVVFCCFIQNVDGGEDNWFALKINQLGSYAQMKCPWASIQSSYGADS